MRASLFVALFGVAACSASVPAQRPVKAPQPVVAVRADTCPTQLDGASVSFKELEQGVALEFTSYDDVSELRRRVRKLGDIQHASEHHRYLEDVENGARIVFPADMKQQVSAIAQQLDTGACVSALPTKPDEQIVVAR
jgi:hypothetical protein